MDRTLYLTSGQNVLGQLTDEYIVLDVTRYISTGTTFYRITFVCVALDKQNLAVFKYISLRFQQKKVRQNPCSKTILITLQTVSLILRVYLILKFI